MKIWSREPRKKPLLTPAQNAACLQWTRNHLTWAAAEWQNEMWPDESFVCLLFK